MIQLGFQRITLVLKRNIKKPFSYINNLKPSELKIFTSFIINEHPQTISLIALHLEDSTLSYIFKNLPDALILEVVMRMSKTDLVSSKILRTVDNAVFKKVKTFQKLHYFDKNEAISKAQKAISSLGREKSKEIREQIGFIDSTFVDKLNKEVAKNNPEDII